jgi:Ca2+/Na+ antiporter
MTIKSFHLSQLFLTLALVIPGSAFSPAPSTNYNASTICKLTNVTDADDCCTCFHSTCALVTANCQLGTGGTNLFNYFDMQYCALKEVPVISYIILCFWILVVFSLLGTTADNFFVVQLETLSTELRLSPSTAAITLLALGNSAPDVFSDVAAVQGNSDFNLAIGELVGASMFLTTVVLSGVVLYATASKPTETEIPSQPAVVPECKVDKTPIRDILSFFIVLTTVLLFSISDGIIDQIEAVSLIGAYVVYVICVIVYTKYYENPKKLHRRSSMFNKNTMEGMSQRQAVEEALIASGGAARASGSGMELLSSIHENEEDENEEEEEEEVLIGIDWDSDASTFEKITFVLEYPFRYVFFFLTLSFESIFNRVFFFFTF